MVERILLVLKIKNLSPSKFADEIGIQRSSMSHIMSGRNLPSLDLVMKIINKFPDINLEWLLMGIGQMIKTKQIDLFEQPLIVDEKEAKTKKEIVQSPLPDTINATSKEEAVEKTQEIDLKIPQIESKPLQNEEIKPESLEKIINTTQPEIEKIVILYKNKSFKEYYPSL